jgi:hypothetical protein
MGGRRLSSLALTLTVLTLGCSERATDDPTSPEFAKPTVDACTAAGEFIKVEFGPSSAEAKLAGDMKGYGAKTSQATYAGYKLLDAIAQKYEIPANQELESHLNPSNAAIQILNCINIGTTAVPTSFEDQLGTTGAFAVRGFAGDASTVTSHDGVWILEPPAGQTWEAITTLATTGLHDSVDNLFLAHGTAGDTDGFTDDELVGSVFDWHTIPTATFGTVSTSAATALAVAASADVGVVVGECPSLSNYIQHNSASDPNNEPEVGGFVKPSCYTVIEALREPEPRSFAERIGRFFSPTPAFAALLTSSGTGTGKRTLSQFGLVDPGLVNLQPLFTWKKSGNTVGKPLDPTPKYQIESAAGTVFQQDYVLIWLEAIGNQGINAKVCNNWAYTNANGIAQFPTAYPTKSGGYTFIARTTGTSSKPGVEQGEAPAVPPGASLISPVVNVKNGTLPVGCDAFAAGDALPDPPGPNGFAP